MTSIKLIVEGARARAEVQGVLTSGMVGIPVTIEYDGIWDGLSKNLVCRCGLECGKFVGVTKTILGIGTVAKVAPEVMVAGKVLYLGIEGYNADGTLVIPTIWACCGAIQEGTRTEGGVSDIPTLPIWDQLQVKVDQIPETVQAALAKALENGEMGSQKSNGIKSAKLNDNYTLTLFFDDGTSYTTPAIRGETGASGKDGVSATHNWNGTTLTVTSASGTSSADLKGATGAQGIQGVPGAKGDKGDTGPAGVSPTVSFNKSGKETIITVTDVNGTKTATINDGADGKDATDPDDIPSSWQTTLENGVEAINIALCEAGYNKSAFLFYSDSHWNYGAQMAPTLLKYLYRNTGMAKTFFGGDIVNDEASDYDTMEYLWEWRKQIKDLPNHHSVVGNHDDGSDTDNLFSEQYVYGYLMGAEETPDIVRGKKGLYYYIDSPAEKTRYLCLDTAYQGVVTAQQEFVKNALLTTPDGWHIVAISHIWHDNNYDSGTVTIGGINSGAATLLTIFENYNSRSGEYADCTGWVEFCIGGHTHRDYDSASSKGIPIILVETDSPHTRSGLTYTKGTTTEASVNGIIADYDAKTIKVVRVGRGVSREVEMTWYEVAYTNLIRTAVDVDGSTIYNGKGYKENIRLSGSSGGFRDNPGSDCTGYMKTPVGEAFTVYMKNITANSADNYGFVISLHSAPNTAQTDGTNYSSLNYYSPVYDGNGNVIQFTVSADKAAGYMVISAVDINDDSIITIDEPING